MNVLNNVRIARVSTVPFFVLTQLRTQLETLADSGALVSIITSDDELSDNMSMIRGCTFKPLFIAREIRFFSDLATLIKLWKLFRKEQYQIIHSTTPKAGLLCAIAAKFAGVPICIHTFTGQPWVTMTGFKKMLVRWSDKLIVTLNNQCYADSPSQRDFLIKNKVSSAKKLSVIGSGSLAGVDIKRFSAERFLEADKMQLKVTYGIDPEAKVVLFVGRVTREKGIFELIKSMRDLLAKEMNVFLMVLGPFEQSNEQEVRSYAQRLCRNRVIFIGFNAQPERFMAISDLLCLPSYREGFGTVVIEAAAMGVPAVGSNIYGLSDAIIDGVTGLLVEPQSRKKLTQALEKLLSNDSLRSEMGKQAKERARKDFDSTYCNELLIAEYTRLLQKKV